MVDPYTGKIVDANKTAVHFYGYPHNKFTQMYVYQLNKVLPKEKVKDNLQKVAAGKHSHFHTRHSLSNNKIRDVEIYSRHIIYENKEVIIATIYDITEKTKIQKALEDSELKFRKAFRISPDSININRMDDGMYVEINDGFTAITGYTKEEVIGKTSYEIDIWVSKAKRAELGEILKEKGVIQNFSTLFRKKNGKIIHGLMSANIIDIKGVPHILSVTRDIEEFLETQEALKQSELKLREVFRTSPDTITISRFKDGRYVEVNESFTANTGYSQEEAIGKTPFELGLWFDNKERLALVKTLKEQGFVQNMTVRFKIKNGNIIHGLLSANIFNIEGEPHILFVTRNIEDDIRTRIALSQSELKFKRIFTISPDAIAITNLNTGLYLEVNDAFLSITGYKHDEIVGKTAQELNIWIDYKQRNSLLKELKKKGFTKNFPINLRMKNGDIVHGLVSTNIIEIDGEPHMISISRNIEDYLQAIEAYHRSEQRYKTLFQLLPAGIILIDEAGTILDANPTYCKNIGYSTHEITGKKIWEVVNSLNESQKDIINYIPTIPKNKVVEKEVVNVRKNGELLYLRLYETRILLENSKLAILSISIDVTREKHIREELVKNAERLKEAQDIGRLGSWELDWQTKELYWSDGIYHLLELDLSQSPNYSLFQHRIHPEDITMARKVLKESIKSGKSFKHIHRLLLENNKIKWVIERGKSFYDEKGKLIRTHGTIQDITRLKEAEDKLRELNELLEKKVHDRTARLKKKQQDLSKLLSDMRIVQKELQHSNFALKNLNHELEAFSYSVSHDLKAPLRAIRGFTSIIKEDYFSVFDENGKILIDDILGETESMSNIIEALLQLSRTGSKNLNFVEFDLKPLAQSIFSEQQKEFDMPHALLKIYNLPPVFADYTLIKQLMANLLSNALKYSSHHPQPLVEIGSKESNETKETVFYVKDNGVGFDEQVSGKMFEAFHRLHSRKDFTGTGIGLAIAKRIVSRHKGKIWATSKQGGGTTLFFTLSKTGK